MAVARATLTAKSQVLKWRRRYETAGLRGLEEAQRSGRPRLIRQRDRIEVVAVACRPPEQFDVGRVLWSQASLSDYLVTSGRVRRMSRSSVQRILAEAELKPHKVRMWCTSNDPDYDRKVADVTGLYLDPPRGEAVVCVDEKTQMQALSRRVAIRRALPHRAGRQEHDYERHGTRCLLGCFDVRSGKVVGRMSARRRSVEFLSFLDLVARAYPCGRVHVVLDNLNTHYGPAVAAWNRRHGGRFEFHYTPFHGSWLNQVEIFFSILARRVLHHAEFATTQDLDATVMRFLDDWNRDEAHPFAWTYDGKRSAKDRALVA